MSGETRGSETRNLTPPWAIISQGGARINLRIHMLPDNVDTIQELIRYSYEILAEHPEDMSEKDMESPAAGIVGLYMNEHYDEWTKKYPQTVDILDRASNLEISNSFMPRGDWQAIRRLVNELNEQVNGKSLKQ